jgi:ceramide glucosyltransferase
MAKPKTDFTPRVCLVMPCKGDELSLERNIEAALNQDYEDYSLAIVTDTKDDPAHAIAESVLARNPDAHMQIHVAQPRESASGKVAALLTALSNTRDRAEAYAFVDSDALIPTNWLAELVDPLIDESIGATTGFRWYFPSHGGLWSHVESAWNAAGTNLLFSARYGFPWGGGMAVRSETLDQIGIEDVWANAISDDMALNSALREHGYRIVFLPQCTVATFNRTDFTGLLEWTTRQTTLTRVFNPSVWKYGLAAYAFLDVVCLLGLVGLGLAIILNSIWLVPSALLLTPTILGLLRSSQRCSTFEHALPHLGAEFQRNRFPHAAVSPLVPPLMMYCIIKSAFTHQIEWRGRKYNLAALELHGST